MTSRHKSRIEMVAGVLPLLLLLSLITVLPCGCARSGSSTGRIESSPTPPTTQTERELLLEIDKKFENPEAHYELGRYYQRAREWTKAEYQYNIALSQRPALVGAQAGLVKLYVDEGEPAKAEQFANAYIGQASSSGNTRTMLNLGWEFENQGLGEYALRCFRQALADAPDSYEANKQMGLYYLGKGDKDKARQYLGRSFELNPRQPDVAGELGRLGVVVEAPKPEPEGEKEKPQK
jgi:tetratricopeptide (TPR) repeat protein